MPNNAGPYPEHQQKQNEHLTDAIRSCSKLIFSGTELVVGQFLQAITLTEQETCRAVEGLFETLNNKFRPQHNKTVPSIEIP